LMSPGFFALRVRPPPSVTLFPYTTLFRSRPMHMQVGSRQRRPGEARRRAVDIPQWPGVVRGGDRAAVELVRGRGRAFFSEQAVRDRKSTRLNSSHVKISYAVFCLKKKKNQ